MTDRMFLGKATAVKPNEYPSTPLK